MRRRSRGVALITAMLITAIVASVATSLSTDNALDVRRTTMMMFHEQGLLVALGAESWARNLLSDDFLDAPDTDHLGEFWAGELPPLPVDNGTVQGVVAGQLEDLSGRFNVNRLIDGNDEVNQEILDQYKRLLRALELDERFAELTVDWLDANQDASFPNGAEDPIYTGMTPPYRTAGQLLTNVTELAALDGMTKQMFDVLLPHITALPPNTTINVNTATPAVLMSLGDQIDLSTVEGWLELREGGGFGTDYQTVFANYLADGMQNEIAGTTSYFQLKAIVQIDTVRVTYYSLMHRSDGIVTVLQRSQGTY